MIGKTFIELSILHPDDLEKAMANARRVFTGETVSSSIYRFITKSGASMFGETSSVPFMRNGRVMGIISVARDITERMKADEALRESEDKYRTILESIEEAYFELSLGGSFTFFSDPLCRILGYSRDELMGMNYREYTSQETRKLNHDSI
jgi:PAS domain-containing protein